MRHAACVRLLFYQPPANQHCLFWMAVFWRKNFRIAVSVALCLSKRDVFALQGAHKTLSLNGVPYLAGMAGIKLSDPGDHELRARFGSCSPL